MKILLIALLISIASISLAQEVTHIHDLVPEEEYENISIKKLETNEHSTSFVIWVKQGVKAHKHELHSESLYVLEGAGKMTIAANTFEIKAGDYFVIPKGNYHSVEVTSKIPMKVISVQAPEFFGKDRVFKD